MSKPIVEFNQPVYLLVPDTGLVPDSMFNLLIVIKYENRQLSLFQQSVLHKKSFYTDSTEIKDIVFDIRFQKGRQVLLLNKPLKFFGGSVVTPKNWCTRVCMCSINKKDSIVKWINVLNGKTNG